MSGTIQSMTGYGNADGIIGTHRLSVEVRSVNHRFFTPSIKLPPALTRLETEVRELLRRHVARGHVSLSLRVERDATEGPRIDIARLLAYAEQLRAIPADAGLDARIDVASLLRLPDVITTTFTGLVPGRYAIKAFHDVNGDGKMGSNPFGMPTEPFAFSNNAHGVMGPAKWDAAAFEVKAGDNSHTIAID